MNKQPFSGVNKRNILVALLCGVMLILVVFGVVIKSVSGKNAVNRVPPGIHNAPTTQTTAPPYGSATANPSDLVVSSQSITPTATVKPKGSTPTTSTNAPTPTSYPSSPAQGTSIYFGVHVPFDSLSSVTAFEADAGKAVSIVMWYQQWGLTNGWQYMQMYWMNEVRSHGSIPLITWDPQDPSNGTANQPAYALQNIINGNFDAYITRWAQDSKAWGHP